MSNTEQIIIGKGATGAEGKEGEPKEVVFEVLIHLKEKRWKEFLAELADDLVADNKYESETPRVDAKGVSLNMKGGRSFRVMWKLAEEAGLSLVGVKWRDDIETDREHKTDHGIAVLLKFGSGKSNLEGPMAQRWQKLSEAIFNNYLWSVDYHSKAAKFGLFGPTEVKIRKDGTNAADEPGSQMVLDGVRTSMNADGVDYTWRGKTVRMGY